MNKRNTKLKRNRKTARMNGRKRFQIDTLHPYYMYLYMVAFNSHKYTGFNIVPHRWMQFMSNDAINVICPVIHSILLFFLSQWQYKNRFFFCLKWKRGKKTKWNVMNAMNGLEVDTRWGLDAGACSRVCHIHAHTFSSPFSRIHYGRRFHKIQFVLPLKILNHRC